VTVLRNVSKDETTKYVLALLDEALIGAHTRRAPTLRGA